jgi:hypothetical protein
MAVTIPTHQEWGDDDYAGLIGFLTEVERVESFLGRTFAVEAAIHPTWMHATTGVTAGARLGGTYTRWLDTDDDHEVFGRYAAFVKSPEAAVRVGAELSGFAIVSERDLSFSERTMHWLTFSGGLGKLRGEPTVTVRIPLDDEYRSDLKTVIGVTIDIG